MGEREIRAVLERHWCASAAGDQDAEREVYADDAICDYPQSGERIAGRGNLQALRKIEGVKSSTPIHNSPAQSSSRTEVATPVTERQSVSALLPMV